MSEPLYPTTDPYLAAFLWCEGATLAGMQRLNLKHVEYRFVANTRLHVLIRMYTRGEPLFVVPVRLFESFQLMKSRNLVRGRPTKVRRLQTDSLGA